MKPATLLLALCIGLASMIEVGTSPAQAVTATAGQLIISEFRVRGPNGANDEFIEIYNASGAPHTVDAPGSAGYGVAASDGTTRCVIPNGTIMPAGGYYLCVNSVGYSLGSYPAGSGTAATGDATYTTDIPDNAGIAIFNNSLGGGSYSLANRLDAVGSTSEANVLYKEGTGYPALVPFSIDHAFVRDTCGKNGSITAFGMCPGGGVPKDTDNNAVDFYFVDTNGTSAGAGQRLGAPGPQNISSPISVGPPVTIDMLDTCVGALLPPNQVRDFTSNPAQNSTFGTLDIRRTITNTSGANIERLRFRVIDLTTFPAPSGFADLRPRTSAFVVVTVDRPPCGSGTSNVTVQGTTLEQPPAQPNGGGFNSSMSVDTITSATPLPPGASVDVRFLLGIQQTGCFKFGIEVETQPGTTAIHHVEGTTDSGCQANLAVTKTDSPDPVNPGGNITYNIGLSNIGTFAASNVSLQDAVPTGTTFVSMTAPVGWTLVTPPVGGTGNVTATIPSLSPAGSASFTLVVNVTSGAVSPITNTATATSVTSDSDPLNNSATATTTVNSTATFTVNKDFVPNNAASVTITVSCTGGATAAGPLPASEAAAAVFIISNVPVGGTTCTATETVPPGYTANQTGCAGVPLALGGSGSCTIINTSIPGTFTVNKDFQPNSAMAVIISVTCTGGAGVAGALPASEAAAAVFTVSNVPPGGTTCTATETVPPGYVANQAACANVALAPAGSASCTIVNTAGPTSGTGPLGGPTTGTAGPGGPTNIP